MNGIEIYSGGNGGPSASTEILQHFTRGMPGLGYVLTDLGRHIDTTPENAARMLDGVAVFRTLTNFRIWTDAQDVARRTMEHENAWLLGEITAHAPPAPRLHQRDGRQLELFPRVDAGPPQSSSSRL